MLLFISFKALFTHKKSEVDFSYKTICLGVFLEQKNHLVQKSRNLDNALVFRQLPPG